MNMKNLLVSLSLLAMSTGAVAQDGKPTKTQTIEFIETNFPTGFDYFTSEERETADSYSHTTYWGKFSDVKVDIEGTKVTFRSHNVLDKDATLVVRADDGPMNMSDKSNILDIHSTITFDLKDIESIDGMTDTHIYTVSYEDSRSGKNLFPMYIVFNAAGGKKLIESTENGKVYNFSGVKVPFGNDSTESNHQALHELKNSQLFKAFEHLRKLSGAPEPLRF